MLTQEGCRARQERLRSRLSAAQIDAIALVHPLEIYYFTGVLFAEIFPAQPALLWIGVDGDSWLTAHTDTGAPLVNQCYTYECSLGGTINSYMRTQLGELVQERLQARGTKARRVGFQRGFLPRPLVERIDSGCGEICRAACRQSV